MKCNPWVGGSIGRRGFPMLGTGKRGLSAYVRALFANNEQGFFYDPNDLSTMFQDSSGTIPVTDVGQPVGLMLDKSGRNNHAFQTASANRPILRKNAVTGANYLEFDGSDDFLQTANIDFTATDKVSLFAGFSVLESPQAYTILAELSTNSVLSNGVFQIVAKDKLLTSTRISSKGTIQSNNPFMNLTDKRILSANLSISADINSARINATNQSVQTDQGTGNYGNYPMYIGRRSEGVLPFNGHIYGLIGVGRLMSGRVTVAIEKELAKHVGVTLNV